MSETSLARALRQKAVRALTTARELQERDPDGSVNRSYYAMFDIARAALLVSGLREDQLPRTHAGLIAAFSKYAVQSGRIDQKISAALSRAESLRMMADYTEKPLDVRTSSDTVARAQAFVTAVEKEFRLEEKYDLGGEGPDRHDQVSDSDRSNPASETKSPALTPISIEDMQRQGRENWLRMRGELQTGREASPSDTQSIRQDYGHSIGPEVSDD